MRHSPRITPPRWFQRVPATPKDKAVVEGLVKILMRYQRFRYRRHRFSSIAEVNEALAECVKRVNERRNTRFGLSRRERFEQLERAALKSLPAGGTSTTPSGRTPSSIPTAMCTSKQPTTAPPTSTAARSCVSA